MEMGLRGRRIYTCTPVAFAADDSFFIRDSGLICRELLSMGVDSKCVMPLPYSEADQKEDIIRTTMSNLESADWWKSLNIDGVVLYSWGRPRYTGVARAVKKAGLRLVIHMDAAGRFDVLLPEDYSFFKSVCKYIRVSIRNVFRARHLRYADVITMAPGAAKSIGKMLFVGDFVSNRNFPMPCPVSSSCYYDGTDKQDVVVCVGRWDDEQQKRSRFLMAALDCYFAAGGTAQVRIFGKLTPGLRKWHSSLPEHSRELVFLGGYIKNSVLHQEFLRAKIVLCPSSHESSHIVSAEGLCSGCSVVVSNRPNPLRCLHWYTTKKSGRISEKDTPESLAQALHSEQKEWDMGNRNPYSIASEWAPYFHVDKVMSVIFE